MHILLGLVAAIGAIGFFIIRLNIAAQSARQLGEVASDTGKFYRRWTWGKRTQNNRLLNINEPKLAVCIMMLAMAVERGLLTERQENVIRDQMLSVFKIGAPEAEELLARAKWALQDNPGVLNVVYRMRRNVEEALGPNERREVLAMLNTIAGIDGEPDKLQQQAIVHLADTWHMH